MPACIFTLFPTRMLRNMVGFDNAIKPDYLYYNCN